MPRASLKQAKERQTTVQHLNRGWPVRLAACESAIRSQDKQMFKTVPSFVNIVVNATETKVGDNQAAGVVEELWKKGCPERELLYLLGMCENRGVGNSFSMTGFDPEQLQTQLRRIRSATKKIETINGPDGPQRWGGTEFGKFLEFAQETNGKPSAITEFLRLPAVLKEYVSLVEHAAKYLGGKSDFYLNIAKAVLVRFVRRRTGQYHHGKVARLLSVMLGPEYLQVNHLVWFKSYQQRLQHYRPDREDSPALRVKKTLLECEAAIFYRMDILHPGDKFVRKNRLTVQRTSDLA
jgi:hypothetical protein